MRMTSADDLSSVPRMPSSNGHTDETIVDSMCESVTTELYVQFYAVITNWCFFPQEFY